MSPRRPRRWYGYEHQLTTLGPTASTTHSSRQSLAKRRLFVRRRLFSDKHTHMHVSAATRMSVWKRGCPSCHSLACNDCLALTSDTQRCQCRRGYRYASPATHPRWPSASLPDARPRPAPLLPCAAMPAQRTPLATPSSIRRCLYRPPAPHAPPLCCPW